MFDKCVDRTLYNDYLHLTIRDARSYTERPTNERARLRPVRGSRGRVQRNYGSSRATRKNVAEVVSAPSLNNDFYCSTANGAAKSRWKKIINTGNERR